MNLQKQVSEVAALLASAQARLSAGEKLEVTQAEVEKAALMLGVLAATTTPRPPEPAGKPILRPLDPLGSIEITELGWVHISLNTLLPHCRYRTPAFLQDAISRLLRQYTERRRSLPRFDRALLAIDEHSNIHNRQIYDQDNKGYKAIPNAIKGVLVPDDDQFTLELALLSTWDDTPSCQIYVLPADEAGEFFSLRTGQYGVYL